MSEPMRGSNQPEMENGVSAPKKSRNPIRWLYDWVLSWANSRFGTAALAVLAFAESSFFPIPPDVLQIALSMERPKRSFYYAFVSALCSVAGALFGYYIGFALWNGLSSVFIPHIFSQEIFDTVCGKFNSVGAWILFTAAFTPIPFKVFTIAAGVTKLSVPAFVLASLIGRSLRFFLVASLLYVFGPKIKTFIDRWFGLLTFTFLVLILIGFYAVKYLI